MTDVTRVGRRFLQCRHSSRGTSSSWLNKSESVASASSRVPNHRAVGGTGTLSPTMNLDGNLITANLCVIGSS